MSVSNIIKDGKLLKSINFRALQIYKDIFGDLRIHPQFVIKTSNYKRVPAYFNGYQLGKHVSLLREWYKTDKSVFNEEELKQVEDMGFVWKLGDPKLEVIRLSFKVYNQLNGNCEVPLEFVVPNSNDWPHITWGVKLGEVLHGIRSEGIHKALHDDLKELGVNFNVQSSDKSRFDRVFDGLTAYKKVFGDLKVPRNFAVQPDHEGFPKHTIGLQLGYELHSIRKGRFSEHMDKLESLGIEGIDTAKEDEMFEKVLEALQNYKSEHGNLQIPEDFVVPYSENQSTSGMKLGRIVKGIRKTGRFAQFRNRLEEIGLVFADKKNKKSVKGIAGV